MQEQWKEQITQLQKMIDDSDRIVFFGGAGVSTESNIPDFRSADGLYHQNYKYTPEQIVATVFLCITRKDSMNFTKKR